jgi:NTE family protein
MSPEEMEKIVLSSTSIFQDTAPRQDQSFERKREDLRGLWDLELGVGKGGIKVPSGIFAGQEVNALLRRMTTRSVGVKTFDDLQIPFRAVATDLRTGDLVVLDRGELAAAMRASMAVPGAFTPEDVDGRCWWTGDCGEPAGGRRCARWARRDHRAWISAPPPRPLPRNSPIAAVAQQMINILLDLNVYRLTRSVKPGDVLISPQVQGFSSGDFTKGTELVPIGVKAARAVQDKLLALSLPEQQYAEFRQAQRARSKAGSQVARVKVDASQLRHVNPAYVKKAFCRGQGRR